MRKRKLFSCDSEVILRIDYWLLVLPFWEVTQLQIFNAEHRSSGKSCIVNECMKQRTANFNADGWRAKLKAAWKEFLAVNSTRFPPADEDPYSSKHAKLTVDVWEHPGRRLMTSWLSPHVGEELFSSQ